MHGSCRVIDNAQQCSVLLVPLHHCSALSVIREEPDSNIAINGCPLLELGCETVVLYNHCTSYMCTYNINCVSGELLDDGQLSAMSKAPLKSCSLLQKYCHGVSCS